MDNNSTYEQYEQEIDLKDLMFAVLHKWRPVILVAVVLAVLLGGAKGAMTYRQQNDPEVSKETREKYQEELDLYEKNKETAEREIENLKTDIANQQEYLDKSIWINMSPYDVCESRIDMYVTTGYEIMPGMVYQNQDYTDTILQQRRDGGCGKERGDGAQIFKGTGQCDHRDQRRPVKPPSDHQCQA